MLSIIFLIVLLVPMSIDCKSDAVYCSSQLRNDYEINRLQTIFTIKDEVYIRVGNRTSKFWVYDINKQNVMEDWIIGTNMFPGLPIIEFVSLVICDNCPEKVSDLAIVIGRESLESNHKFVTFRLQSDNTFVQIDGKDLPENWGLGDGEEDFILGEPFHGFFPEEMVTSKTKSSQIFGFTYLPSLQIFHLKFTTDLGKKFIYKKVSSDGSLTDWKDIDIVGTPRTLNSIFFMKEQIFAVENDSPDMPRISHEIIVDDKDGDVVFRIENIDKEARNFFHCYDGPTSEPPKKSPKTPVSEAEEATNPLKTTSTTILTPQPTTASTPPQITEQTTESTTSSNSFETTESATSLIEVSTTHSITDGTEVTNDSTVSEIKDGQTITDNSTDIETPSLVDDEEDDNKTVFWIIFFVLILAIILIIIGLLFLFVYMKKRGKGDLYNTLGNEDERPSIVLASSPSNMSVRSNQEDPNFKLKSSDIQSPSITSMRSNNEPKRSTKSSMKGISQTSKASVNNASTVSIRTLKT